MRAEKTAAGGLKALLSRLGSDSAEAAEHYEQLRWKLIKYFEWSKGLAAEDLADETLERVAVKLGEQIVEDVVGFLWGVAKRVKLEGLRKANRIVSLSAELKQPVAREKGSSLLMVDGERLFQDQIDNMRIRMRLRACLSEMKKEDRELLLEYHSRYKDRAAERRKLAEQNNISINALRVRVNWLHEKLFDCVTKKASRSARISKE